jgi:hypothetical protein
MHGLKNLQGSITMYEHDLRMSHGLQTDISRQGSDLQMPLEVATVSDMASASKKCPWAAMDTKYVPCGLKEVSGRGKDLQYVL